MLIISNAYLCFCHAAGNYARVSVPDKVKSMNIKVFNFMSRVNEARVLVQHESCKCNCRLTESGCNSK